MTTFRDRTEAGERLAERLVDEGVTADIVLGVPRGGLPVARPVADALGVPLDIVVAKKLGAPRNPELAIGSVAADGSVYLDQEAIEMCGVDEEYIEAERERAAETAWEKAETYRDDGPPELAGKSVVVVDDGVATGATLIACVRQLRSVDAAHITVAVPVGSPESLAQLEDEADAVVALQRPAHFQAVGQFYDQFGQVSDEEARAYLRADG